MSSHATLFHAGNDSNSDDETGSVVEVEPSDAGTEILAASVDSAPTGPACAICATAFTFFERPHTCRHCKVRVCAACSSKRARAEGYVGPVRVCESCFEALQEIERREADGAIPVGIDGNGVASYMPLPTTLDQRTTSGSTVGPLKLKGDGALLRSAARHRHDRVRKHSTLTPSGTDSLALALSSMDDGASKGKKLNKDAHWWSTL